LEEGIGLAFLWRVADRGDIGIRRRKLLTKRKVPNQSRAVNSSGLKQKIDQTFQIRYDPKSVVSVFAPADFITHGRTISVIVAMMSGLQQFIRSRRFCAVVAICLAYTLTIQALMGGVGVGMSAFASTGEAGFLICNHSPAPSGDPQKPSPLPQCPFCLLSAQTAGHLGLAGEAPTLPLYARSPIGAMLDHIGDELFVPLFRRTVDPRGPPSFFV
jgi:hypothetical protein